MPLTEAEQQVLTHNSMWGSDGYPLRKLKSGWAWGPVFGINGPPKVFKTKREAAASFEAYIDILCDKKAGRL